MTQQIVGPVIDRYWLKQREPEEGHSALFLSESMGCQRKRLLRAEKYAETHPIPDENLGLMETGNVWERWLGERLDEAMGAENIQRQVRVVTKYGAGGRMDFLFRGFPTLDITPVIIECKVTRKGAPIPKEEHIAQVQAYLHFYGREHGITDAELVYIYRETLEVNTLPIVYDPEKGAKIEADLQNLAAVLEAKELLPVDESYKDNKFPCYYRTRDYECYCPFWGHCWGAKVETEPKGA